jgi:hypothetical protein
VKDDDLQLAVNAWRSMFGKRLPRDFDELNEELFRQASEQANVVTLVVRQHGFEPFLSALKREAK